MVRKFDRISIEFSIEFFGRKFYRIFLAGRGGERRASSQTQEEPTFYINIINWKTELTGYRTVCGKMCVVLVSTNSLPDCHCPLEIHVNKNDQIGVHGAQAPRGHVCPSAPQ